MGIDVLLGLWLTVAGWLTWTPPPSSPAAEVPAVAITSGATAPGGGVTTGAPDGTAEAVGGCGELHPGSDPAGGGDLRPGSDPLGGGDLAPGSDPYSLTGG